MQGAAVRQDTETFRFQISLAIPESQLFAWFEQAAPGERIVYCRGFVPLREDAAWKLAGAWQREGLVHLVTEKDGRETKWIAERRPTGTAPERAGKRNAREDFARTQARVLLDLLRTAAERGEACPSRKVLAGSVCGVLPGDRRMPKARDRVGYLMRRLETEGRIAIRPGSATRAPVVTILARGRACGLSTKGEV